VDAEIVQTRPCSCGRKDSSGKRLVISVSGCCSECIKTAAADFNLLCDGKITYTEFIMRLERKGL
jgi:dissimilatory sulfite reductase (desulfoviridin) alpha/beta subunit